MPHGDNLDPGVFQRLAVRVTRVLVLYFNDLTPRVRAALLACKMRALRRMTLRTLDSRHCVEFPIGRATAARFTARCFPLEVRHFLFSLRNTRARARVFVLSADRAYALAVLSAQHPERNGAADELRCQIFDVQTIARQNVARAERISLRLRSSIELFVDVDVHRAFDIA